jgi:DNA excision repair protein ERCC-3
LAGERCLLFRNDHSILVTIDSPGFDAAREGLRRFAELRQAAGAYHVYQITDIALWSAAASGMTASEMIDLLRRYGQHAPPPALVAHIQQVVGRYGYLRLTGDAGALRLVSEDRALLARLARELRLEQGANGVVIPAEQRGAVKAKLAEIGYPVVDEAALSLSPEVEIALAPDVHLRPYQDDAVARFVRSGLTGGVILLPCGSGKTVIGVAAAANLRARTLVITPSRTIGDQWQQHFLRLTNIEPTNVSIYRKGVAPTPVTIATYQALTARNGAGSGLAEVLDHPWGLIIYDEVHSLPADVFRQSAEVQSIRRLGLTATLVREDGREREVFSLVGPTVYSAPWRDLERRGWIAPVDCIEVRIEQHGRQELTPDRALAAKLKVLKRILRQHTHEQTLVVAHHLKEVAAAGRITGAETITGESSLEERQALYRNFREGELDCLVLSRVANVGVDLPDASVLIQISGAFGSRQEEAQRVGRILRPKPGQSRATFYTLVTAGSREVEFAARRQRFLIDQGYRYRVVAADSL